jgi:hypothetical protein
VIGDKRIDGVPSVQKLTEYIEAALAARRTAIAKQ